MPSLRLRHLFPINRIRLQHRVRLKPTLSGALLLSLVGCADLPLREKGAAAEGSPAIVEPGLEPMERFRLAVQHLEQGRVAQARAELVEFLDAQPTHPAGRSLLEQIDIPASAYFPRAYEVVTLGPGESLSTLAKQYLGDPMQFFALARYNRIDTPNRVQAGWRIRVPLMPVSDWSPEPEPLTEAVQEPEPAALPPALDTEHLLAEAQRHLSGGRYELAAAAAAQVAAHDPTNGHALDLHGRATNKLIDQHYRQATRAFQRQDLNATIAHCDRVLELDPKHTGALLYRTQALDLKARLARMSGRPAGA